MAVSLTVVAIGLAACGSSSATPGRASLGKVVCPSSDKYSCYYLRTNSPVSGPLTVDGHRVVGLLPTFCKTEPNRCSPTGVASFFEKGPPGEYLGWKIRKTGPGNVVEVYITKAEEMTRNFRTPPTG